MGFLPINRREMQRLGWEQPDFVYVTGDAYVDHPSFGHAIISRILESHGYKVAILPQPDWRDDNAIHEFGKPRLGFLVSSGNMDSMVNHYSVSKKRRQMDAYTPGGVIGKRPDYADVVYGNYIRRNFPDSPITLSNQLIFCKAKKTPDHSDVSFHIPSKPHTVCININPITLSL